MSNDTPEREPFDPTKPHDVVIPADDREDEDTSDTPDPDQPQE